MKRICFTLDLKPDPELISTYKKFHEPGTVWKEVTQSIYSAGVSDMEIYLLGNRLFMIMEVEDNFDPTKKAQMDASNPHVQKWEALMEQFQQRLPWVKDSEKWVEMERIFKLDAR